MKQSNMSMFLKKRPADSLAQVEEAFIYSGSNSKKQDVKPFSNSVRNFVPDRGYNLRKSERLRF